MLIEKEIHGSIMLLDTNDVGISKELLEDGTREHGCPYVVESVVKPGFTCIDIGANIGLYALIEARLTGATGRVYAIEPFEHNLTILRQSVAINGYSNITPVLGAIGKKNGRASLRITPKSNLCHIYKENVVTWPEITGTLLVREMTLDKFVEEQGIERVDFLRFDVEGYEVEVVQGAGRTLASMPVGSWVFAEFHTCLFKDVSELQPAIQAFIDNGFIPRRVIPDTVLESVPAERFAEACCTEFRDTAPRVFFQKR